MKILLLSENATIQKLFTLSAQKRGDEVSIGNLESIPEDEYDVVFIDKALFSDGLFNKLKSTFSSAKFVLILDKKDEKIPGFDEFIVKPFLPTDLIELLENINKTKSNDKLDEDLEEFDLESFDDLDNDDFDMEEDFVISDDELDKEVDESEEEEDFIIEDDELEEKPSDEEELINEDIVEEEALEDEISQKEEVDEDFAIEELDEENEKPLNKDEETLIDNGEINEEEIENEDLEELDKELESIDEKSLAEAIGEDLAQELEKQENETINENNEIHKETSNQENIEEKTLGSILNINWEELKKAKAKVTITIDFGG